MVRARCELSLEIRMSHVTNEETEGFEETWQGLFLDHSCIKLPTPTDSVLSYLPPVFDLFEGEAVSQKSRS